MIARLISLFLLVLPLSALPANLRVVTSGLAPSLPLTLASGRPLEMAALKGQVVLVNFWATWCPPCRREMPSMDRLDKMETGRPFTILAVNVREEADQVERFLEETPVSFPIVLDTEGKLAKAWKAFVFPTSYLVDKKGRIRFSLNGTLEWDDPEIVELIDRLMLE